MTREGSGTEGVGGGEGRNESSMKFYSWMVIEEAVNVLK